MLLLQVAQQIDDLRLHRHVERAGRLVEHARISAPAPWRGRWRCAGAGRRRTRADSGPGVRIEADLLQRGGDARAALVVVELGRLDRQAFLDDLADRHARRQRAVRVLEHDLHVFAQRAHFAAGQPVDALADVGDRALARRSAAGWRVRASSCPSRIRRRRRASGPCAASATAPSTALTWSTVRRSSPRLIGNQTFRSSVSTTTGAASLAGGGCALRLGGEQLLRVGVLRRGEDLLGRAFLDDLAVAA